MVRLSPAILTVFIVCAAAFAGCAKPAQKSDVNILDEVTSLKKQLGCKWQKVPDLMYPAKGHDYMCVTDIFSSVIVFVQPSDEILDGGAPAIEKITLIWKEWHKNAHIVDGKTDASRAIAYLAQRFFPQHMAIPLVDTFLGTRNKMHTYEGLKAVYNYEEQLTLNLHQLDIYNNNRHKRMFAFPALHTHMKQEAQNEPTQNDAPAKEPEEKEQQTNQEDK